MTTPPNFDPSHVRDLDVRDIIQRGGEPLGDILTASEALPPGGVLHLRSPFQPLPLYRVMAERGFRHHSTMFGHDDWSTWFWRADEEALAAMPTAAAAPIEASPVPDGVWDLRDLPAPEPLLAIIERTRDATGPFRVALPFHPTPLGALLEGHGWRVGTTMSLADGSVVVEVRSEIGDR
ncbi:MAG TPA: DUF2249 domain-containing protein [Gemmatimonadales bacterium]|nr:DUF2249 domain-containing protein [Gemmatimonadales bacterium]